MELGRIQLRVGRDYVSVHTVFSSAENEKQNGKKKSQNRTSRPRLRAGQSKTTDPLVTIPLIGLMGGSLTNHFEDIS
jgi:hypothetical protein